MEDEIIAVVSLGINGNISRRVVFFLMYKPYNIGYRYLSGQGRSILP